MKKFGLPFVTCLFPVLTWMLFLFPGCSAYDCGVGPLSKDASAKEKWEGDLECLYNGLINFHKNPFSKHSEAELKQKKEKIKKQIKELSPEEIILQFQTFIKMIGDSHTGISIYLPTTEVYYLPFLLLYEKKSLYIIDANESYKDLIGTKVLQMDHAPVQEISPNIERFIIYENESWRKKQMASWFRFANFLKTIKALKSEKEFDGIFEKNGKQIKRKIQHSHYKHKIVWHMASQENTAPFLRHTGKNYWFDYLEKEQVLYIQYNRCAEQEELSFQKFSTQIFEKLAEKQPQRIIFDLRYNIGGNNQVIKPWFEALKENPQWNTKEKLYVIIGRDTFSSGMDAAIEFREKTNATMIGERTGGKPSHYGEVKTFRLPNSKLKVFFSTKLFDDGKYTQDSFLPDIELPMNLEKRLAGKDPFWPLP